MNTKQTQKKAVQKKDNSILSTLREILYALGAPEQNKIKRIRGGVDKPFLIIVLLLLCFGSVMVSSAGYAYAKAYLGGDSFYFIKKQLVWAAIGIVAMIGMSIVDYGVNLLIVSIGATNGGTAPIFTPGEIAEGTVFVDPIPMALTLTSIVISACVTAMALALVIKMHEQYHTLDTREIRRLNG